MSCRRCGQVRITASSKDLSLGLPKFGKYNYQNVKYPDPRDEVKFNLKNHYDQVLIIMNNKMANISKTNFYVH